jgi:hypothetical protein
MIEFTDEGAGNIVGIRATGKLSEADYLEPSRGVGQHCLRSEAPARPREDRDRGRPQMGGLVRQHGAKWLMKGQMRTFPVDQLAHAWEWLRA